MKVFTYFDISLYDFILFSLNIRVKPRLITGYTSDDDLYNKSFEFDFLDAFEYIKVNDIYTMEELFK